MKVGQSSEVFADYTLSRLPREIRKSLDDAQYRAIRDALLAVDEGAEHAVDIRIRIPLFYRAYYVVVFAGRDRRSKIYMLERYRIDRLPRRIRRLVYLFVTATVTVSMFVVVFFLMYKIKSLVGLDLFPAIHLRDYL